MKITHMSNSFLIIESGQTRIACDPWVGSGNHGGWHSFPEFLPNELIDATDRIDAIYISHLHSDHFDPAFLKKYGHLNKTYIINEFPTKVLRSRLQRLGVKDIVEIAPFSLIEFGDLRLTTVPQMSSNSSGLPDDLNYDLDSSLIVTGGGVTFFNQVDNPLLEENFVYISNWIKSNIGSIDVATLASGAASEYPQCFVDANRKTACEDIVSRSVDELATTLSILDPRFFFPSGGTYFIPGRFHKLNEFVAVPTFDQIGAHLANTNPNLVCEHLEGGKTVTVKAIGEIKSFHVGTSIHRKFPPMTQSINDHANDPYDHDADKSTGVDLSDSTVLRIFSLARVNYIKSLNDINIQLNANIQFVLYDTMELDNSMQIASKPVQKLEIALPVKHETHTLTIHIEKALILRCLQRKAIWNQALSGSLCLFERQPNVFHPTDVFSLNFLVTTP
jgi:UDP-MurNAc hydroxylase